MTTVAVVAKAGTRYQVLPGFADGLENFMFKVCFVSKWCLYLGDLNLMLYAL